MEDNKNNNIEDDMSMTFVGEIGQKSAIATSDEVESLETNAPSSESAFPEVKIDPPTNEMGKTIIPEVPDSVPAEEVTNTDSESINDSNSYTDTNMNTNMTTNTNDLGPNNQEPSFDGGNNKKNKKGHPVLVTILLILFLVGGTALGWYFSGYINKFLNKEETKTEKKEPKEVTKASDEEISPNSLYIKNLISDYDFYSLSNADVYSALYSKDKVEVKDLDDIYLRAIAAKKANKSLSGVNFSSDEFKDAVTLLFGNQLTLEDKSISNGKSCVNIQYDSSTKYYSEGETACGGAALPTLERKIIKAVKKQDTIEVNVAVAILSGDPAVNKVFKTYNESNDDQNNLGEVVEGATKDTFDIDKDYTKLNQYKYTFNYDKDNNNYYLTTIELIK